MDINPLGITALKILREDPLTAHIPVVVLSANAIPRDIEKGLDAGFFRYLTKPNYTPRVRWQGQYGPKCVPDRVETQAWRGVDRLFLSGCSSDVRVFICPTDFIVQDHCLSAAYW